MAIAYTGQTASGSAPSGTAINVTVPGGGFSAGNQLLVVPTCEDNTYDVSSVSAGGNTYTQHLRVVDTPVIFSTVILGSIYLASGLAAASTIAFTMATSVGGAISVYEYSGLVAASSGVFDKSASALINFDTAFDSTNTAATAQADELLFGINYAFDSAITFSPLDSYSEIDDQAWFASWRTQTQYKTVSATGAYKSTATASGNTKGLAVIGTFKAATGVDTGLAWIRAMARDGLQDVKRDWQRRRSGIYVPDAPALLLPA